MKKLLKLCICIALLLSVQSLVSAQIGYSIADNNGNVTDSPGAVVLDQQYYQFNLATGAGTLISPLVVNGQQITREYEGLGSSGSILLGISEYDTELCNTGSDPIIGLASDVRIFRANAAYPLANGVQNAIGPQIGETCFPAGFTDLGAAYNPVDGFMYAVISDDTLPATGVRSRLFRVSTTTGLATAIGAGAAASGIILTAGSGGDAFPYLDGMAILPNGIIYASDAQFTNNPTQTAGVNDNGGLYRLTIAGPNAGRATFIKYLFDTDQNSEGGLANNGSLLYLMLEDGRVYTTTSAAASPVTAPSFSAGNPAGSNRVSAPGCLRVTVLGTPFCGDFEGFDIPNNGNGLR